MKIQIQIQEINNHKYLITENKGIYRLPTVDILPMDDAIKVLENAGFEIID